MSYQALYRVYRPRSFKDVIGQSHITKTLQNALRTNRFSHAYLFSGPRGTGKTSVAKIVAQTINCERMPTDEPCNECAACIGIREGSIPDVIEIDAASNTSVDDIRDIRDKVKFAPSSVPYKVYIIDEVHMISTSAFNALLKTLEEPPAHVVFILATTEPHKIPLTIISRCQRFEFKSISTHVIKEQLAHIMERENIAITEEALEAVALAAEGGMRDALSILDQVISYSGGNVSIDDVLAVTGGVSQDVLTEITEAMYLQDAKKTLELFDALMQHGKDPGRFLFDMIYFLRDMLFYQTTSELAEYLERAILTEQFKQLAKKIDSNWIQEAIEQLTACEQQIKWTNSPKVFVEIALISIATLTQDSATVDHAAFTSLPAVEEMTLKIKELEQRLEELTSHYKHTSTQQIASHSQQPNTNRNRKTYDVPYERIRHVLDEAKKEALNRVRSIWVRFLDQLKQTNAPAHATIQDSKPVAASDTAVVVSFKYEIHCSLFLEHKPMIESVLQSVSSKTLTILAIPDSEWTTVRANYLEEQKEMQPATQEENDPLIEEARKLVGDDLLEIRD